MITCRPVASHPGGGEGGGGGLNLDRWNTGADTGFPEGGVKTFTSTHTPLGHCPCGILSYRRQSYRRSSFVYRSKNRTV